MHRNRLLSVLLVFVVLPFGLLSCGGDDGSGPETFSVSISPSSAEVPTGGSTTLTARVTDGSGATVTGRSFTWSSSNETVATVDGTGTVQGLTAGQTTVTATTDGGVGFGRVDRRRSEEQVSLGSGRPRHIDHGYRSPALVSCPSWDRTLARAGCRKVG